MRERPPWTTCPRNRSGASPSLPQLTSCQWNPCMINIIDTPGHVDFTIEVERSLRVLDGAVGVFCGVSGVEPQSETVWRQSESYHVPKLAFVNKMDRLGANFEAVVDSIRTKLGANPVPVQYPDGEGADFRGVFDLVGDEEAGLRPGEQRRGVCVPGSFPGKRPSSLGPWREKLIEAAAEEDEEILDLYLGGEEVPAGPVAGRPAHGHPGPADRAGTGWFRPEERRRAARPGRGLPLPAESPGSAPGHGDRSQDRGKGRLCGVSQGAPVRPGLQGGHGFRAQARHDAHLFGQPERRGVRFQHHPGPGRTRGPSFPASCRAQGKGGDGFCRGYGRGCGHEVRPDRRHPVPSGPPDPAGADRGLQAGDIAGNRTKEFRGSPTSSTRCWRSTSWRTRPWSSSATRTRTRSSSPAWASCTWRSSWSGSNASTSWSRARASRRWSTRKRSRPRGVGEAQLRPGIGRGAAFWRRPRVRGAARQGKGTGHRLRGGPGRLARLLAGGRGGRPLRRVCRAAWSGAIPSRTCGSACSTWSAASTPAPWATAWLRPWP